jgi:hypothetical protein
MPGARNKKRAIKSINTTDTPGTKPIGDTGVTGVGGFTGGSVSGSGNKGNPNEANGAKNAGVMLEIVTPPEAEARSLANLLVTTYLQQVDAYRTELKISEAQAEAEVQKRLLDLVRSDGDDYGQHIPPSAVDWLHLASLAERNPQLLVKCWQSINQTALDDLQNGFRAARAVATAGATPWEQAQFLALRASLVYDWQPRGGVEIALIDMMTQALTLQERWMLKLLAATRTQEEHARTIHSSRLTKEAPRLSEAQAVEQAAAMVDRFNRLFMRTLRQLRDLRRYTPAVTIQNADQVNIGGQQINAVTERTNHE